MRSASWLSRDGRLFIWGVICLGLALLAGSVVSSVRVLSVSPLGFAWLLLAVLTWVTGSFTVKVPAVPATIYVSETFLFAMILIFGVGPAVITIAIDGFLISMRHQRRETIRHLFNIAEPAISVGAAAGTFYLMTGARPFILVPEQAGRLASLIFPVLVMSAVYFLFNSGLTAVAVAAETGESAWAVWRQHFMWLGLNTAGGASLGLVLASSVPKTVLVGAQILTWSDLGSLGVVLPLLVISYVTFRTSAARVEDAKGHLVQLNKLYVSTVETLATAIDAKDQVTHGHIRRVQAYAVALARAIGVTAEAEVKAIETAALLHDMGKLSVPEAILSKPGKLTAAEYERMKLHAPIGADILSQIDFPYPVAPIVRHHHENWNGTGYPDGIAGEAIPLGARIMSVVDCYDALVADRPYRPALSEAQALAIIVERRGTMYEPRIVDAFLEVHAQLAATPNGLRFDDRSRLHTSRLPAPIVPPEERVEPRPTGNSAEEILLLCELAEDLDGRTTLHEAAEAMSWHLKRMVPAALVAFHLPDEATDDLVVRHASGVGAEQVEGLRQRTGAGLSGWVAENRTTIVNSDPMLDLGARGAAITPPLLSALSVPLMSEGRAVGVLSVYAASRDAFTEEHRRLVELVAAVIAEPIRNAAASARMRETCKDDVTGLPNAWRLARLLTSRALSARQGVSLGVVCFAVGAEEGDSRVRQLRSVASATRQALRSSDLVFRQGENELVILLPDTAPEATKRIAARIVAAVQTAEAGGAFPVRVGLAFAPEDGRSIDELLAKARSSLAWEQGFDGLPNPGAYSESLTAPHRPS